MYVVTEMNEEVTKYKGAPATRPASEGTGSANSVSPSAQKIVIIGSPFVRIGSITMENRVLWISYESFGMSHIVHIGAMDLQRLVRDRFAAPAPVMQIRKGVDGSEITEKIGYACRTVSGKAIKIQTSTSGGDMVVSWTNFLQVMNGKVRSAAISRIKKDTLEVPGPAILTPGRNIREGLAGGF